MKWELMRERNPTVGLPFQEIDASKTSPTFLILKVVHFGFRNDKAYCRDSRVAASTATIIHAPYLQYYLVETDRLYWNGYISIWCQLESGIGLIAACLPALRVLFRKYFDGTRDGSGSRSKQHPPSDIRNFGGSQLSTPMDALSPTGKAIVGSGKWKRLEDNNSSHKHIIQERTVTIETESLSDEESRHRMV
ncbi:hypothetical protein G7Y89_g12921 [Cudoniella acicularis]|uniref:Uncharacterized protein n=1 Tax=Cudoniella acicularis TaxID=354080 RepID=A0A8H4R881_9HELO|nr:hypothetical protein G7Y89_g12921 [Cudoniella acicularis]